MNRCDVCRFVNIEYTEKVESKLKFEIFWAFDDEQCIQIDHDDTFVVIKPEFSVTIQLSKDLMDLFCS